MVPCSFTNALRDEERPVAEAGRARPGHALLRALVARVELDALDLLGLEVGPVVVEPARLRQPRSARRAGKLAQDQNTYNAF